MITSEISKLTGFVTELDQFISGEDSADAEIESLTEGSDKTEIGAARNREKLIATKGNSADVSDPLKVSRSSCTAATASSVFSALSQSQAVYLNTTGPMNLLSMSSKIKSNTEISVET